MNTSNTSRLLQHGAAMASLVLLTLAVIPALSYAQTQAQPNSQAPVASELQAMKAQLAQLQSQVNYLAAASPAMAAAVRATPSSPTEVTLTGKVTCAHCDGVQPLHKGYTQFSWALYSVRQGDDIVLVARDQTYKLQGNNDQLERFMCQRVRVSGRLEGGTVYTENIHRATTNE
jgi:hypothetical protein